jgi:hypothetical protein
MPEADIDRIVVGLIARCQVTTKEGSCAITMDDDDWKFLVAAVSLVFDTVEVIDLLKVGPVTT